MNNLNSLADFIYALMNDFPESSGIDDDNSSKKDNFFRKYHTGLQDLKNINYDRLYQLVSEQSNKFIPSVATIINSAIKTTVIRIVKSIFFLIYLYYD